MSNTLASDDKKTPLTRRGSRHAPPEVRHAQLLAAAVKCFGANGYHGTTTDDIAAASGLSKGSLYRFFKSKDELLLALLQDWEARIDDHIAEFEHEDPLTRLDAYICATADELKSDQDLIAIWLEFFLHKEAKAGLNELYARTRKQLAAMVKDGIEAGQFKDVSPTKTADALIAIHEGIAVLASVDASFDIKRRITGVWKVLQSGLVK